MSWIDTCNVDELIGELRDMGVDESLIRAAMSDPRLIRGLYLYVCQEGTAD